jgi:hypothetical protein
VCFSDWGSGQLNCFYNCCQREEKVAAARPLVCFVHCACLSLWYNNSPSIHIGKCLCPLLHLRFGRNEIDKSIGADEGCWLINSQLDAAAAVAAGKWTQKQPTWIKAYNMQLCSLRKNLSDRLRLIVKHILRVYIKTYRKTWRFAVESNKNNRQFVKTLC